MSAAIELNLLHELLVTIEDPHISETNLFAVVKKYSLDPSTTEVLKKLYPRRRAVHLYPLEKGGNVLLSYYTDLLKSEGVKDFIGTEYSSAKLLSIRSKCHIYATERCVIKCYLVKERPNDYEKSEFKLHKLLQEDGCLVPELIEEFETKHYRCYVMTRLEVTFDAILSTKPEGLGQEMAKRVASSLVPTIERIHKAGRYYRDFSVGNVALHKGEVYMLDFGATNVIYPLYCCRFTPRYASRGMVAMAESTVFDDYEALGYVLLDIANGFFNPSEDYSYEAKCELFKECTTMKGFLGDYFRSINNRSISMLRSTIE